MSKMHVSRYIDKSEDGEQLIFDVADETSEEPDSDSQATIAELTERIAFLEDSIGSFFNSEIFNEIENRLSFYESVINGIVGNGE